MSEFGDRRCHIFSLRYLTRSSLRSIAYDDDFVGIRSETSIRRPRQITDLNLDDPAEIARTLD